MPTRVKLSSLIAAVVGLLLIPATAFAYAPTGDDFITCVAAGGDTVECAAGVFDPDTDVDVLVQANPVLLDTTVTADPDGEVAFDVPDDQVSGEVTVTLSGTKNGEPFVLSDVIATVGEPAVLGEVIENGDDGGVIDGDDGEIANTGSNAGLLAIGALGAIALGGAALVVTRRKNTRTTA